MIGDWIMIYAVEEQTLGDRKVTLMFAGRLGTPSTVGNFTWDGHDEAALRDRAIAARAAVWFI